MHPIRRTATLLSLTAGTAMSLAAIPATAYAIEPTTVTVHLVSQLAIPCPSGVVLSGRWDVTRDITTFYDQDGTPVRQEIHAVGVGATTNPVNGVSLPNEFLRVFHKDLVTGEQFSTGPNLVTHLPDGGIAIGGAGRLVFDASGQLVEHVGPDTDAERAELCAAIGA